MPRHTESQPNRNAAQHKAAKGCTYLVWSPVASVPPSEQRGEYGGHHFQRVDDWARSWVRQALAMPLAKPLVMVQQQSVLC